MHRTLPHVRHIAEETKGLDKVRGARWCGRRMQNACYSHSSGLYLVCTSLQGRHHSLSLSLSIPTFLSVYCIRPSLLLSLHPSPALSPSLSLQLVVLNNVIERHALKKYRTLVFCNTVKSARAVEYALSGGEDGSGGGGSSGGGGGGGLTVLSYHGELNSKVSEGGKSHDSAVPRLESP